MVSNKRERGANSRSRLRSQVKNQRIWQECSEEWEWSAAVWSGGGREAEREKRRVVGERESYRLESGSHRNKTLGERGRSDSQSAPSDFNF